MCVSSGRDETHTPAFADGLPAGARDSNTWGHQLETPVATRYTPSVRAPERLTLGPKLGGCAAAIQGRAEVELGWVPTVGAADAAAFRDNLRLWTLDDADYVEIDVQKRQIRAVAAGQRALFPAVLPAWSAGDAFVLRVDAGNGVPHGSYTHNGGAETDLGAPGTVQGPILCEDAPLDLASNGVNVSPPTGQLEGVVTHAKLWSAGAFAPAKIFYASPAGTGDCLSAGSPCSLAAVQTAVQAWLATAGKPASPAAGGGATAYVLLRGDAGWYTLDAPLAFGAADGADGFTVVWKTYPGHPPAVISGGTVVKGPFAVSDAAHHVYRAPTKAYGRQLWVGAHGAFPTPALRSRSQLQISLDWHFADGVGADPSFEAPDATIAGYAHPEDVELDTVETFRSFRMRVASASGTVVNVRQDDFTNARYEGGLGNDHGAIGWYENQRELVANFPRSFYYDTHAGELYYQPAADEGDLSKATVVAGNLESLATIRGVPGKLRFENLVFAHATWTRPDESGGFSTVGGYAINGGFVGDPPAAWKPSTAYTDGASLVSNDGNLYRCVASGTSGTSGPKGKGGYVADGSASWEYISPTDSIGFFDQLEEMPAAIQVDHATVTFAGVTFRNLGLVALNLHRGCRGCLVSSCTFQDISGTGLRVAGFRSPDSAPSSCTDLDEAVTVEDNLFTNVSREYVGGFGISATYTPGIAIRRNTLDGLGYVAIHFSWGLGYENGSPSSLVSDYDIAQNAITHAFAPDPTFAAAGAGDLSSGDGGGIYCSGGVLGKGVRVHDNYVSTDHGLYVRALYADGGTQNTTRTRNVIDTGGEGCDECAVVNGPAGGPSLHNVMTGNFYNSVTCTGFNTTSGIPDISDVVAPNTGVAAGGYDPSWKSSPEALAIIRAAGRN